MGYPEFIDMNTSELSSQRALLEKNVQGKYPTKRRRDIQAELIEMDIFESLNYQDKYLLTVIHHHFKVVSSDLREPNYKTLIKAIEYAKNLGVDISQFELLLPGLEKKVYTAQLTRQFEETKKNLRNSNYNKLVDLVNYAKSIGLDVSLIEPELPELQIQVYTLAVENGFKDARYTLSQGFYDELIIKINKAKEIGINVAEWESELPELHYNICESELVEQFKETKENLTSDSYNVLIQKFEKAKQIGVYISSIEKEIYELGNKVLLLNITNIVLGNS